MILYLVMVYDSDIREMDRNILTERETHSKRPLLISADRIIRELKTIN